MEEVTPGTLRLLIDPPAPGAWNMAVDEVLLDSAAAGLPTWRFYEWSEPTLSLGYFQNHLDRASHAASRACAMVRRASGGGAIVHDVELTYSLALPVSHTWARQAAWLYRTVHQTLVDLWAAQNVIAQLGDPLPRPASRERRASEEPFLCFQRRAEGDILIGDYKVVGSAQRRRGGAIVQHGSVLLRRSSSAPELPGVCDLSPLTWAASELRARWTPLLAARLGQKLVPGQLSPGERASAQLFVSEKYGHALWTTRR